MTQVIRIRELAVPLRTATAPPHLVERRRARLRRRSGWAASVGAFLVLTLLGVGVGYFLLVGPDGAPPPGPVPATAQVPADDQRPAEPAGNRSPSRRESPPAPALTDGGDRPRTPGAPPTATQSPRHSPSQPKSSPPDSPSPSSSQPPTKSPSESSQQPSTATGPAPTTASWPPRR